MLFQTLNLYFFKLYNMSQAEVKELTKQLPESEHSWVDAIPEIFGEKSKKQGCVKALQRVAK